MRVRRIVHHADHIFGVEVDEDIVVEGVFLESARIYRLQTMERIDAQLLGTETDDGAMVLVQGVDGEDFRARVALAVNPVAGEGGCKVGVGDGRYGKEEVGVYHMVVYEVGGEDEESEGDEGNHGEAGG